MAPCEGVENSLPVILPTAQCKMDAGGYLQNTGKKNKSHDDQSHITTSNGRRWQKVVFATHVTKVPASEPRPRWEFLEIRSRAREFLAHKDKHLAQEMEEAGVTGVWLTVSLINGKLPRFSPYPIGSVEGQHHHRICVPMDLIQITDYKEHPLQETTVLLTHLLHHPNVILYDIGRVGPATTTRCFMVTSIGSFLHGVMERFSKDDSGPFKVLDKYDPNNGWIFYKDGFWLVSANNQKDGFRFVQLFLPDPIDLRQKRILWDTVAKKRIKHGLACKDVNVPVDEAMEEPRAAAGMDYFQAPFPVVTPPFGTVTYRDEDPRAAAGTMHYQAPFPVVTSPFGTATYRVDPRAAAGTMHYEAPFPASPFGMVTYREDPRAAAGTMHYQLPFPTSPFGTVTYGEDPRAAAGTMHFQAPFREVTSPFNIRTSPFSMVMYRDHL